MQKRLTTLALAAGLAALVGGCGSSDPPARRSAVTHFPHLGYHPEPARLPAHLPTNSVVAVSLAGLGYVRPAALRLAADATLSGASWTSWGASSTTGRGTATVRICTSSCGAGHFTRYPATVVFSGIRRCGSVRYYENARITLATVKGPRPWGAYLRVPCAATET